MVYGRTFYAAGGKEFEIPEPYEEPPPGSSSNWHMQRVAENTGMTLEESDCGMKVGDAAVRKEEVMDFFFVILRIPSQNFIFSSP